MNFVSLRKYLEMNGMRSAVGEAGSAGPACAGACQAWLGEFDELFPRPADEPDSAGEFLPLALAGGEASGEGGGGDGGESRETHRQRTIAAALELARQGRAELQQEQTFGPLMLRGVKA